MIGGRFALRREIGHGGMGVVWEAVDQTLRRPVAIKQLAPKNVASADARRRFEQEATMIARLRNEHIVQVHDYGDDDGSPYIVMELLEGEDLEVRLRRVRQLPAAIVLRLLRQIGAGLEAASAEGVVHCDLKPANLFLARTASSESVKILDFGLGWRRFEGPDEDLRESLGGRFGTPAYMSPELIRGAPPHPLTDLWSLGVVVYRALTGQLPFPACDLQELILRICTDPFPPPSSLDAAFPPGLDRFFERALAKDRTRRFASARELVAAFAAACDAGSEPAKILVVNDEPDVRQKLSRAAYELVFADDCQRALDELRRHPDIDVVVIDIPMMDGLTLLEQISLMSPAVRTVVVSSHDDMPNIRRAMNRGAIDFLLKPINFEDLEVTLKKTLRCVEEHRRRTRSDEENDLLRKYTSAALVERLQRLGPVDATATEAMEATVVFVGVFLFTRVVSERPPAESIRLLNAHFEVIVPELLARGGAVDRFVGDAVVAVFRGPEHLDRALSACIAVCAQLDRIARCEGSPDAGVCTGISKGNVLAAGIGSHACGQLGYMVLGEAVMAASQLARAALPGEILVDRAVCEAAGRGFTFKAAGARSVWPRAEPSTVYMVVPGDPALLFTAEEPTIDITRDSAQA
ncbi:protein kinase domain-containing protein [Sorangium sp. So ce1182]|uniref:protein kinase domain-containing protein n=1 Tax=Sorangium sp. So ce1182 TaxID=3133334 RepID=UPI003F644998